MNIRLNDLRDIDSANGNGTFKASFFLDTAFWVPWWDSAHFETQATVGTFSDFEPHLDFPEVDAENGRLRWGLRTAEFSKDTQNSRQHETQLGQNFETLVTKPTKRTVSVVDACSHWPRLWRVCINEEELAEWSKMDKKEKKKVEPSNEEPTICNERLKRLFTSLDKQRTLDLSNPSEGIAFVTYEVSCIHRCAFQLHEFPFDMHSLKIVVRLNRKDGDPMNRSIIPIAHDKGFFISSRVAKMVNYHLARNLDWAITKENVSFGSNQLLNASAIVRRKPGYFVRNYVIIIFLLTSSSFSVFLAKPDEYNTRASIIFTVLLSVVAFKYSGSNHMPRVSYATILDAYILLNFYIVLAVAAVSFGFSTVCQASGIRDDREGQNKVMKDILCSENPGRWYHMDFIPAYSPVVETSVGIILFLFWLGCNSWYWLKVYHRVVFCLNVIDDVNIGWMMYPFKGPGKKGQFCSEKFMDSSGEVDTSIFAQVKAVCASCLPLSRGTGSNPKASGGVKEMAKGSGGGNKTATPITELTTANVKAADSVHGRSFPEKQGSSVTSLGDVI